MRFFALACDYDGTIAQEGRVDAATLAALERVASTGRRLLLVSGRRLDDLLEVFPGIGIFDRVVAENGALLYHPATKEEVPLCEPVPRVFARELTRRGVDPVSAGRVIVATWEPHEKTVLETIRDLGLELQVIFNKGAVMVLPAGVNKATGLAAALEALGLSAHNLAGIGDAENDHAFLSICEVSAAVANALPIVKKRADFVTAADHGAGVVDFAERLIARDLADIEGGLTRHQLAIGTDGEGQPLRLRPFGPSLLLAGTSGSGKSTLAKVFLEGLCNQDYQFCIVDPEGDYEDFEEGVVVGSEKAAPRVEEVGQLLETPAQNAVVNLLGVALEDRPAYFAKLMTSLLELRARTGRPHWIVVDEAHHLMPTTWEPASLALPQELYGLLLITVHPDLISPAALRLVDTIATVGETPAEMITAFALATGGKAPSVPAEPLSTGEALIWSRSAGQPPRSFTVAETRLQHRRHLRKYAEGDLGPHSFFFRGPDSRLNLRAQNLFLFLQIAEGLDDETWTFHLECGDYGRWFREAIKNDDLAAEADEIAGASMWPSESRRLIRDAVEKHYTLPAPARPAAEHRASRGADNNGSPRPDLQKAAEYRYDTVRRNSLDPVALLKEDHAKVKGMFQEFERMKDRPQEMKRISDQAIMELQIHSMIEEELFYPALRRGAQTEEILNEAEEEHHVVDLLIKEILKMKPTDQHFSAKFMVLAENTKHHIQEEESEMLPKAQGMLGGRYQELGDQMTRRKQELMKRFGGKPKSTTRARSSTTRSTSKSPSKTASTARARSGTTTRSRATAASGSRSRSR